MNFPPIDTVLPDRSPCLTKKEYQKIAASTTVVVDPALVLADVQSLGYPTAADFARAATTVREPWAKFDSSSPHAFIKEFAALFATTIAYEASLATTTTTPTGGTPTPTPAPTTIADVKAYAQKSFVGLPPAQKAALDDLAVLLADVNGQDAYSVTALALGTLKKSEYLFLPDYMRNMPTPSDYRAVGAPWDPLTSAVSFEMFVDIYALNKEAGKETKDPIFFGLMRAEAVKMGWFMGQSEVVFRPRLANSIATFSADKAQVEELMESAKTAAFVVPLINEFVFRTTGHHYLTGLADEYERKYQAVCSACLAPDLTRRLRAAELWHWSMHWVTPRVARMTLEAQDGTARIPHAVSIRKDAAPAGTAIVTTTSAVIAALRSCNWADEVAKHGGFNFAKIEAMANAIVKDVTRYHNAYFAYGVTALGPDEVRALEEAKAIAINFAPVAQGFIEAMYTDSSLGRAKALRKHADASPVLMRKAVRVFKNLARAETEEIADIFKATTSVKATAIQQAATIP